jgi:hypothetical protein
MAAFEEFVNGKSCAESRLILTSYPELLTAEAEGSRDG